jgi:hypothetical protein
LKRLDSKVLLDHPRTMVVQDSVRLPNGQMRLSQKSDAVTVICLRDEQILLQREYSYPAGEFLAQCRAVRS